MREVQSIIISMFNQVKYIWGVWQSNKPRCRRLRRMTWRPGRCSSEAECLLNRWCALCSSGRCVWPAVWWRGSRLRGQIAHPAKQTDGSPFSRCRNPRSPSSYLHITHSENIVSQSVPPPRLFTIFVFIYFACTILIFLRHSDLFRRSVCFLLWFQYFYNLPFHWYEIPYLLY